MSDNIIMIYSCL